MVVESNTNWQTHKHSDNTSSVDYPGGTAPNNLVLLTSMASIAGSAGSDSLQHESKEEMKSTPAQSEGNDDDLEEQEQEQEDDEEDDKIVISKEENEVTKSAKKRRELPPHTVAILKGWMLSPQHVKHPYPTDEDKQMLLAKTGINMKQLTNWFTNARKRIWKPMMRREHSRQLQSGIEYDNNAPPHHEGSNGPKYASMHHSYGGPPPSTVSRGYHRGYDSNIRSPTEERYPMSRPLHQPHSGYPPLYSRATESDNPSYNIDGYMESMRIRKRAHDEHSDNVMEHMNSHSDRSKRFRRSPAAISPHIHKILQDWVAARPHIEYAIPSDSEKLQISRDTGLDIQQIEDWFETNVGRFGVAQTTHQSPAIAQPPYRSIPTPNNSMYPPPPTYGEHRSIPSHGVPMFPQRSSPSESSSVPTAGNAQFPPPPRLRDSGDTYRNGTSGGHYHSGSGLYPNLQQQYLHTYNSDPRTRSLSTNAHHYTNSIVKNASSTAPTGGLPSLSNRPTLGTPPSMGQPRDGRSHTLDMGVFADARRRNMTFQDILASTTSDSTSGQFRARVANATLPNVLPSETLRTANAENEYPNSIPHRTQKGFEPSQPEPVEQGEQELDTRIV